MPDSCSKSLLDTISTRADVIRCLRRGITDKREITDELDVSRPTVDRAFRTLVDEGVLVNSGSKYDLTLYGQMAHECFERLVRRYECLSEVSKLFSNLPADADIDARVLEDVSVSVSKQHAPHEPFRQVERIVREASELRVYLPVVIPRYVELFHERAVTEDVGGELILRSDIVNVLAREYDEQFRGMVDSENYVMRQCVDPPLFGVGLVDSKQTWIEVYDADGSLRGTAFSESEAAVDWATECFDRFRTEPVEPILRNPV